MGAGDQTEEYKKKRVFGKYERDEERKERDLTEVVPIFSLLTKRITMPDYASILYSRVVKTVVWFPPAGQTFNAA